MSRHLMLESESVWTMTKGNGISKKLVVQCNNQKRDSRAVASVQKEEGVDPGTGPAQVTRSVQAAKVRIQAKEAVDPSEPAPRADGTRQIWRGGAVEWGIKL